MAAGREGEGGASLRPRGRRELAQALAQAREEGRRVRLTGRGTKEDYPAPPRGPYLTVDLTAWDRVVRYRPEDLTVTVEAGIGLDVLEAVLAERGQTLGWDVPGGRRGTVGGALATGVDGPRQAHQGRMRDDLLEVRAMLADGQEVRTGAPVVKSVAGYDLTKLWVGSLGCLGAILEVTLKVRPRPRQVVSHRRFLEDDRAVADWHDRVGRLATPAAAVVVVPPEGPSWGLVRLEGRTGSVAEGLKVLGPGELLEEPAGEELLLASLQPGPSPWLYLATGAPEALDLMASWRLRVGGGWASVDLLRGGVRLGVTPAAAQGAGLVLGRDRPYRWEGAGPWLGGRPVAAGRGTAPHLEAAVRRAFDPEGRWAYPCPTEGDDGP